jgi:glycosyltransferase involved in cell wall biosynthesis
MKILLTVPHLVPTASPYREMMAIAKHLPRDEFALTVCALRPAGFSEASVKLARVGVEIFVSDFRPTTPTLRGLASAARCQSRFKTHGHFDLQHSLDFTSSPFEGLWARAQGRKFVYTQRNLNEDGHPWLLKMKVRLATGIIVISRVTESLVRSLAATHTPISTIPLGFDFDDLPAGSSWNPSRDAPIILSVGHMQRRKRIEDAIRAVALVRQRIPTVQLWVVGRPYDKAYEAELLLLAKHMGISDSVKLLGVREDVIALMGQSSALLHCADSEAFGWSLLEAMAVGLPVVSYDSGGPAELIEHGVTGFLSRVGDYVACSRDLCGLLEDAALAGRVSRTANEKARADYTAKAFAERHASFYRASRKVLSAVAPRGAKVSRPNGPLAT